MKPRIRIYFFQLNPNRSVEFKLVDISSVQNPDNTGHIYYGNHDLPMTNWIKM